MRNGDSNEGNDPDVWQGLKGAAHLADMANRVVRGRDPRMRDKVDVAGEANVKDLFSAFSADTSPDTVEPHADLRDTKDGVEVVVDTSGTPVDAASLEVSTDGKEVSVFERDSGYEANVTTEKPVADHSVDVTDSQLASIHLVFEGGNDHYEPSTGSSDPEPEPTPTPSPDDGVPTLNEFLEQNPYMEGTFKQMLGPEMFEMAVSMYGDKPMDEIPIEEALGGAAPEPDPGEDTSGSASISGGLTDTDGESSGSGFSFGDFEDDN